jgi:hypothetical protein
MLIISDFQLFTSLLKDQSRVRSHMRYISYNAFLIRVHFSQLKFAHGLLYYLTQIHGIVLFFINHFENYRLIIIRLNLHN